MKHSIVLVLAVLVLVAACGADAPSATQDMAAPATAAPASARPTQAAGGGPRPIVIDTDLAADDILAIMVLLRDPTVDVRAVTVAGTGEVRCPAGLRNARRLLAAFGRTDIPVACGRENPGPNGRWFPVEWRDGADAFYGIELPAVDGEGARDKPAAELLVGLAADAAGDGTPLTLVPLGPWTNLADAAALDPRFAGNLAGIHAMGGAIDVPGNISAGDTTPSDGVEWNLGADPDALAAVLALDVPITFVPLDATNDVPVPADIADQLASDHGAAGADIAYEMYLRSPYLSTEGNDYWDTLTAVLLGDPAIARWEDVAVRADTTGSSAGRLVRDAGGRKVRAAMAADRDAFMPAFLAALRAGAPRSGAVHHRVDAVRAMGWDHVPDGGRQPHREWSGPDEAREHVDIGCRPVGRRRRRPEALAGRGRLREGGGLLGSEPRGPGLDRPSAGQHPRRARDNSHDPCDAAAQPKSASCARSGSGRSSTSPTVGHS